ncbi:MAG: cob(I)yrinic acid a,c-diamide adenosyltransferase [Cyanobacteria bacterium P01_A01_bin.123]
MIQRGGGEVTLQSSVNQSSEKNTALDQLAETLDEATTETGLSDQQYKRKMQRRKEVQQQRLAERTAEKGLVIVYTGNGKGKTTAALGMVLRSLGHGFRVAIVQFIKGAWEPAEKAVLGQWSEQLVFHAMGEGFTWETQDRDRDVQMAQAAWQQALTYVRDPDYRLVLLDEVNIALKLGYLSPEQVLTGLSDKPEATHVILTGRGAPPDLIDRADLVTEMTLIKHPFKTQGIKAQAGIEF